MAEKARKKAYRDDANATKSRVPYWCPKEEWLRWKFIYETLKHESAKRGTSLELGPYWCPVWDWDKWY
jgi:hypothetical protein